LIGIIHPLKISADDPEFEEEEQRAMLKPISITSEMYKAADGCVQ
jgi:hypothetical protein